MPGPFRSRLLSTMKTHAIYAPIWAVMMLLVSFDAFAAETAPSIYLIYDASDVLPQSQVATIKIQLGLEVRIDDQPLGANPVAKLDKKTNWAIVDLAPGPHLISAKPFGAPDVYKPHTNLVEDVVGLFQSKETRAARTDPRANVFQKSIVAMPGQIYDFSYTSRSTSSRADPIQTTAYTVSIIENKDSKLRDLIDTYRQQYKKQLAAMPPMSMARNEAEWGKKRLSIPVPDNATQFEMVAKCLKSALNVTCKEEYSGDGIFVASFMPKPLHKAGIYMRYNNSSADIYGEELADETIKAIKSKMPAALKLVTPTMLRRFALEYPEAQWGTKLVDVPVPAGQMQEKVKMAAMRGLGAYGWKIENSNDSIIIGSLLRGDTKYALYIKYDTSHVVIHGDEKIKGWAANVGRGVRKFIDTP